MTSIKKNIQLFITFILILISSGCDDFLNPDNPAVVTIDYYDTKIGQQKLITDLFEKYRTVFNTSTLQFYGTDMYMAVDESPLSAQLDGYNKDLSGLSSVIDGYWNTLYKIIQEANILLNRCTPEIAGDDYEKITAQAGFFRAMAYYYLVETFGPVPLLTNEVSKVDDIITQVTRESEDNIYQFIITELTTIKGILPEVAKERGGLSDAAVKFFLGKIHLTRAYRSYARNDDTGKAIELFESVITSTHYRLLPSYANVFDENNQNNAEVIWAIQYGDDKNFNGSGNPQHTQLGFNITALYPGMFALDQREYSAMQRSIWVNPIVHEWYRYPDIDTRYDVNFKREFYINDPTHADYGQLGIYLPKWNDTSGDSKDARYFYPFKKADGEYNWYPALGAMGWSTDCMPMCKKFKETKIEWGGKGTREDIIFRMADAYLLCAEAYLKDGQNGKALEKVNAIILRAAGNEENYEIMKIEPENDLTLNRLLEERSCEMFGEHDRWFDLKRTNTLIARAKLNPLVMRYNNISDIHLVRPIPYNERIKLNGLEQNPGYNN